MRQVYFIGADPFGNIINNLLRTSTRDPAQERSYLRMIGHVPRNIDGTSAGVFRNCYLSADGFLTETCELLQRNRSAAAPAYVAGASGYYVPGLQLPIYKVAKGIGMKQITNLKSPSTEPCVLQGAPKVMTRNPQRKDTLICLPKLARAGDYSAAVDDNA